MAQLRNTAHHGAFSALVAQEELAKSFLLGLVDRGIIPWSKHILRASRDHRCRQLLFMVMDYLNPDLEEFRLRCNVVVIHKQVHKVPQKIRDTINILRHEKIGRWESKTWDWAEDPDWDAEALPWPKDSTERERQDLIYVRLGKDGTAAHHPKESRVPDFYEQKERANRMAQLAQSLIEEDRGLALDWKKIEEIFRTLFRESVT
ncbi:MAG: hypothetical protein ACREX3_24890 [Gammaproteobacteria bacterium]